MTLAHKVPSIGTFQVTLGCTGGATCTMYVTICMHLCTTSGSSFDLGLAVTWGNAVPGSEVCKLRIISMYGL